MKIGNNSKLPGLWVMVPGAIEIKEILKSVYYEKKI